MQIDALQQSLACLLVDRLDGLLNAIRPNDPPRTLVALLTDGQSEKATISRADCPKGSE